jgi:hypothetical protein
MVNIHREVTIPSRERLRRLSILDIVEKLKGADFTRLSEEDFSILSLMIDALEGGTEMKEAALAELPDQTVLSILTANPNNRTITTTAMVTNGTPNAATFLGQMGFTPEGILWLNNALYGVTLKGIQTRRVMHTANGYIWHEPAANGDKVFPADGKVIARPITQSPKCFAHILPLHVVDPRTLRSSIKTATLAAGCPKGIFVNGLMGYAVK